ncbi:hypothetical protein OSB04_001538 [Centaurea solstitialis]|uniref:Uncharacterized protein n=1 Tax=Centaurea solstitialis TaxID=347529 RepID=A0AA38U9C2_9ASTR|nr:hypothetical protein OSB04_001538 [Centaurea solstitialis]
MIHFLDLLDENLMKSICEGPIRPTVTVAAVPRTDTCAALPAYVVEKRVDMYSPEKIERHLIDKRALTLLIMALPNDIVPGLDPARRNSVWSITGGLVSSNSDKTEKHEITHGNEIGGGMVAHGNRAIPPIAGQTTMAAERRPKPTEPPPGSEAAPPVRRRL